MYYIYYDDKFSKWKFSNGMNSKPARLPRLNRKAIIFLQNMKLSSYKFMYLQSFSNIIYLRRYIYISKGTSLLEYKIVNLIIGALRSFPNISECVETYQLFVINHGEKVFLINWKSKSDGKRTVNLLLLKAKP